MQCQKLTPPPLHHYRPYPHPQPNHQFHIMVACWVDASRLRIQSFQTFMQQTPYRIRHPEPYQAILIDVIDMRSCLSPAFTCESSRTLAAPSLGETPSNRFTPCRIVKHFQNICRTDCAICSAATVRLPRIDFERTGWPTKCRGKLPVWLAARHREG